MKEPVEITLASDRDIRYEQIRQLFPEIEGNECQWDGTREAALKALAAVDPLAYSRTRNHIEGEVTRLSPYFRHGVLTLREAADFAVGKYREGAYKFVFELAWRDFWRRVWEKRGTGMWLGTLDHVEFVQEPEFVNYKGPVSRFTKYWKTVQGQWFPKT